MTRTIQDDDLLVWEAYPSSGENGFPDRTEIVFVCLSDRDRRPRSITRDGATADVEQEVEQASEEALCALLRAAHDVS